MKTVKNLIFVLIHVLDVRADLHNYVLTGFLLDVDEQDNQKIAIITFIILVLKNDIGFRHVTIIHSVLFVMWLVIKPSIQVQHIILIGIVVVTYSVRIVLNLNHNLTVTTFIISDTEITHKLSEHPLKILCFFKVYNKRVVCNKPHLRYII